MRGSKKYINPNPTSQNPLNPHQHPQSHFPILTYNTFLPNLLQSITYLSFKMVSFTALISTLAIAIAATNAQVDPGQVRASINCKQFSHSSISPYFVFYVATFMNDLWDEAFSWKRCNWHIRVLVYGSTNCGQEFIEQDTVFLPANTPAGSKSVGVCYDLTFASVGVAQLLRDPSPGNTCTRMSSPVFQLVDKLIMGSHLLLWCYLHWYCHCLH